MQFTSLGDDPGLPLQLQRAAVPRRGVRAAVEGAMSIFGETVTIRDSSGQAGTFEISTPTAARLAFELYRAGREKARQGLRTTWGAGTCMPIMIATSLIVTSSSIRKNPPETRSSS